MAKNQSGEKDLEGKDEFEGFLGVKYDSTYWLSAGGFKREWDILNSPDDGVMEMSSKDVGSAGEEWIPEEES